MAKYGKEEDPDLIRGLVDSGSYGKGFNDIGTENTASLGLKHTAAKISASLNAILDEDEIYSPLQIGFQYVTAKLFETRDNSSLSFFSGSQAFEMAHANKVNIITANSNISTNGTNIDNLQIASSSFASASGSLAKRVAANFKAISDTVGKGLSNATGEKVSIKQNEEGNLVFTVRSTTFTLTRDG